MSFWKGCVWKDIEGFFLRFQAMHMCIYIGICLCVKVFEEAREKVLEPLELGSQAM